MLYDKQNYHKEYSITLTRPMNDRTTLLQYLRNQLDERGGD